MGEIMNELMKAQEELEEAAEAYERAESMYRQSSSEQIAAKNRLNDKQKQMDAAICNIKKDAPRDTTWDQPEKHPVRI